MYCFSISFTSLSADSIYAKASHGLVEQLGDPYSTLMEREDFKQITELTTGNYGGLGMQIDVREGWITVVAPLPETPAERAGISLPDAGAGTAARRESTPNR